MTSKKLGIADLNKYTIANNLSTRNVQFNFYRRYYCYLFHV